MEVHYEEPPFYENGMDDSDKPCKVVLSDESFLDYLDTHTDEMLYEKLKGVDIHVWSL